MPRFERILRSMVKAAVLRPDLYTEDEYSHFLPEGTMSWTNYDNDAVIFAHDNWAYAVRVDFWSRIVYVDFPSYFEGKLDSKWSLDYLLSDKELFS